MTSLVMLDEKEKQLQTTGGQFCYQHAETEIGTGVARNNIGCFREHEKRMEKYMFVIGVLFTLALGPFFGVQIVEATQDEDLYVSGVPSAIFFLCSLLMSVCRGRQRREVSRLWVLAGMVWVICGWIVWLRKDFTEKPLQWLIVAAIQSVAFALFGLPVFLTDPFIWIY